jgi:hypothetical protein
VINTKKIAAEIHALILTYSLFICICICKYFWWVSFTDQAKPSANTQMGSGAATMPALSAPSPIPTNVTTSLMGRKYWKILVIELNKRYIAVRREYRCNSTLLQKDLRLYYPWTAISLNRSAMYHLEIEVLCYFSPT